jgi:hypothetical protein
MNAVKGTSITAEIGECVASTLSTRKFSTPVAIRSEHAYRNNLGTTWREKMDSGLGVEVDASETRGMD